MNAEPLLTSVVLALTGVRLETVLTGNAPAALQGAPVTMVGFDVTFRATRINMAKSKRFGRRRDALILRPDYPASALYRIITDDRGLQMDFMPVVHGVKPFNSLRSRADRIKLDDDSGELHRQQTRRRKGPRPGRLGHFGNYVA